MHGSTSTKKAARSIATAAAMAGTLLLTSACTGAGGEAGSTQAAGPVTLNVASVSNPDMDRMQKLVPEFEKSHPNIKVKFTTLPENTLRDKLTQDVATKSGAYDLATVGVYEVPIWAQNGWIENVQERAEKTADYDVDDLLPSVRSSISYQDKLHAVPFYAESSFIMYRKDLFEKAGLTMPEKPTWDQIADFAEKLDDKSKNIAGICLRGEAGWGSVFGPLGTMVHAYDGHFYDSNYNAGFTGEGFTKAATQYVDMVKNHGQPGASSASFPECLNTFTQGNAAMWYDATVAASTVSDTKESKIADKVGFAQAPTAVKDTGGWLWTWSLAMTSTSKNKDAAWEFMSWATSKEYIKLVGEKFGANLIPPGTRKSTYELPEYKKAAASYADLSLKAIEGTKTNFDGAAAEERSFYVAIPQWQDAGTTASQFLTQAIAGSLSTEEALKKAQESANAAAKDAGLQK